MAKKIEIKDRTCHQSDVTKQLFCLWRMRIRQKKSKVAFFANLFRSFSFSFSPLPFFFKSIFVSHLIVFLFLCLAFFLLGKG